MVRAEIEDEIRSLRREIEIWQEKRNQAVRGRDEMDANISAINKQKISIEESLQNTFNLITKNFEKITGRNRFKDWYLGTVREILWGNKTSEAMGELDTASRETKNKFLEYEDIIEECDNKIYIFEQELAVLIQQLNQIGE